MKTNRILTAAWGILYLFTPIWTYFIMRTEAGGFVGAINSVLPALMGVLTAWLQKWYPKRVASGKRFLKKEVSYYVGDLFEWYREYKALHGNAGFSHR